MSHSHKVLIAALHWGIGHASRCIPIARAFEELGWEVTLASDGAALDLLRISLPHLTHLEMPSLKVSYSKTHLNGFSHIGLVPHIVRHIKEDHKWLDHYLKKNKFDLIISDHRLGCWNSKIPSVLVAHQLNIPFPNRLLFLNRFYHRLLKPFTEIWVPDAPGRLLSGVLSTPPIASKRLWNMGALSRFYPAPEKTSFPSSDYILAIASGPPPQRQFFINGLLSWAQQMPLPLILVEGSPGPLKEHYEGKVRCFNHLPTQELSQYIMDAAFVVARSGYSTIMDLAVFKKPTLLVPTPGQWEQEYLAEFLKTQYGFQTACQNRIPASSFRNVEAKWPTALTFFTKEALEERLNTLLETN